MLDELQIAIELREQGFVVALFQQVAVQLGEEGQLRVVDERAGARLTHRSIGVGPLAKERLHSDICMRETLEAGPDTVHEIGIPELVAKEEQRDTTPVHHEVPHDLARHDTRVSHQRVLTVVGDHVGSTQGPIGLVIVVGDGRHGLAAQVAPDQVARESIGDPNEVTARRVEGIDEDPRIARETPAALTAEDSVDLVGVVFQRQEVHLLVGVCSNDGGTLRLVSIQPLQRSREVVQLRERMEAFVAHDPHAGTAFGERYQPHPIACAHQVIGAESPRVLETRAPALVVRPVVRVDRVVEAEPHRVALVPARARQAELLLQQAGAPTRVDEPATGQFGIFRRARRTGERYGVVPIAPRQLHGGDAALVAKVDAELACPGRQSVLELTPVDLKAGHREEVRWPTLDARGDVAIFALAHEEAQAELRHLTGKQLAEPEHLLEVVARYLDRRLAHFVGSVGDGMRTAFDDQDARAGDRAPDLERQTQSRQPAPSDRDVVARLFAHPRPPLTEMVSPVT